MRFTSAVVIAGVLTLIATANPIVAGRQDIGPPPEFGPGRRDASPQDIGPPPDFGPGRRNAKPQDVSMPPDFGPGRRQDVGPPPDFGPGRLVRRQEAGPPPDFGPARRNAQEIGIPPDFGPAPDFGPGRTRRQIVTRCTNCLATFTHFKNAGDCDTAMTKVCTSYCRNECNFDCACDQWEHPSFMPVCYPESGSSCLPGLGGGKN